MQVLNEGENYYIKQCKFKGLAHTCESHVVTYSKQQVRSPPTRFHCRLKLTRDCRLHRQGLLIPQLAAFEIIRNAPSAGNRLGVYCAGANCKNYSRAITVSLVGKNAVNII